MNQQMELLKKEYFSINNRKRLLLAGLAALVFLAILWSLNVGPSTVDLKTVGKVLWDKISPGNSVTRAERVIVMNIRLPRICASILVGVLLANAGLLMQGIFQNPLVSPYTLGVSNGAAFGASLAIVLAAGFTSVTAANNLVSLLAFVFAALTMYLVQMIGKIAKDTTKNLLLAGVAVSYLFSSLVSFVKYTVDEKDLPALVFWQMGSVSDVSWNKIAILLAVTVVSLLVMTVFSWDLNVIATGEESSISLGVNYKRLRRIAFLLSTLMTGVAVAFAGTIGFVGMVAPHVARMIVGNDYRYTIPTSSLCGALLLLVADSLSRMLVSTVSLPIGVITSMIGVPFFIWLIVRKRGEV